MPIISAVPPTFAEPFVMPPYMANPAPPAAQTLPHNYHTFTNVSVFQLPISIEAITHALFTVLESSKRTNPPGRV
jgi:hypothetical protein